MFAYYMKMFFNSEINNTETYVNLAKSGFLTYFEI